MDQLFSHAGQTFVTPYRHWLGGQTHCGAHLLHAVEGTFLALFADESGTGGFAVT